jgi:protease II
MISIGDHETSEYRVLAAGDPLGPQTIVSPRETGLQYDIEEGGDIFILTNADGAKDFKVATAPSDPSAPIGKNSFRTSLAGSSSLFSRSRISLSASNVSTACRDRRARQA